MAKGTLQKQKKTGIHHLKYRDPVTGRHRTKSMKTCDKREAEKERTKHMKKVALLSGTPRGSLRFLKASVIEVARLETDSSPGEAERATFSFTAFANHAGDVVLAKIDDAMIEDFQRRRLRTCTRSTVAKDVGYLIGLLRHNGIACEKPKAKPGKTMPVRAFTRDEVVVLFNSLDSLNPSEAKHAKKSLSPEDKEHRRLLRCLFSLLLVTGARPAELIPSARPTVTHKALLKREVNLAEGFITIRTAKRRSGQRKRPRRLPLPSDVVDMLAKQMKTNPGEYVFPPIHNLSRDFDRTLERAGIEKVNSLGERLICHSFRHTFGELAAEGGMESFTLQLAMGHSEPSMTARYIEGAKVAPVISMGFVNLRGDGAKTQKSATRTPNECALNEEAAEEQAANS